MVTAIHGVWQAGDAHIYGATVTLPMKYAGYLVTGLSQAVVLAGSSFWVILAFFLHIILTKWPPQDATALHLQYQTTLVNAGSAPDVVKDAVKTGIAWRGRSVHHLFSRSVGFMLPPMVVWGGFAIAGILVADAATEDYASMLVRVEPDNCGFLEFDTANLTGYGALSTKSINDTIQARNYMSNFYLNRTTSPAVSEPLFMVKKLNYTTNTAAACPAPDVNLCIPGPNGAVNLTTLPIDSYTMLGINTKKEDRVELIISTACSPIDTSDFIKRDYPDIYFNMGPSSYNRTYTYWYNMQGVNTTAKYVMDFEYAFALNPNVSLWEPIEQLARDDADLTLLFFSPNNVAYFGPVYDPFFMANLTEPFGSNTFYTSNYFVNVMLCADQYKLCNPNNSTCTAAGGIWGLYDAVDSNTIGFNPRQYATAERILNSLTASGTMNSAGDLGASALFASSLLSGYFSPALPDNQWHAEVAGWFGTSLAKVQNSILQYAINGKDLGPYMSVDSPYAGAQSTNAFDVAVNQALQDQCTNQLAQLSGTVQNFSALGVAVVGGVTVLLLIVSLSIEKIVHKFGHNGPAWAAREADDKFHLQRMAIGMPAAPGNVWNKSRFSVPVLQQGNERIARPEPVHNVEQDMVNYENQVRLAARGPNGVPAGPNP